MVLSFHLDKRPCLLLDGPTSRCSEVLHELCSDVTGKKEGMLRVPEERKVVGKGANRRLGFRDWGQRQWQAGLCVLSAF